MYIVTGGAGFIGSNLVRKLIDFTHEDIIVVDDLSDGKKYVNLSDLSIYDYLDQEEFLTMIREDKKFCSKIKCVFHQGACTDTTEWDGKYMMKNNFTYSKLLLHACLEKNIRFIYASSAAVYGASSNFKEQQNNELPLNVYGYSKLLFDQYVRRLTLTKQQQVVGLRYFNVYGPRESHKHSMASVIFHFNNQIQDNGAANLFKGSHGFSDGEQRRDFVFVDDICDVNLWFFKNSHLSGIYNVGTGSSSTFNQVAEAIINWHKKGKISYIDFPEKLMDTYQSSTKADLESLREVGYTKEFININDGIDRYLNYLAG